MSPEAVVLAALNAARPTGIAAMYALVSAPAPRRLLVAYIAAGLAWSLTTGLLVVGALHGVDVAVGDSSQNAILDVLLGTAAIGFAAGLGRGRWSESPRAGRSESRAAKRLRDPSLKLAAGAGVATHMPGIFYLLGLNAIAAPEPGFVRGAIGVVVFNLIWFSTPVASLALVVRRPETTRALLGRVQAWGARHERAALVVLFALVGAYFTAKGALNLLD